MGTYKSTVTLLEGLPRSKRLRELGRSASSTTSVPAPNTPNIYFEPDLEIASLIKLKGAYSFLGPRFGLVFEETPETDVASSPAHLMLRNLGTQANPNYALYTPLPLITGGDQIVISGTPGQGGGGGGAGYLYELGDIYHDNAKTVVLRPNGQQRDNGDVLSFDSSLGVWVALQKSSLLSGYALESYVDSEIWDSIQALNLGAASTYGVGTVASGNNGLVTGGSVYSAINDAVSSALKFQGTTTTAISDGSTTNPIVIGGSSYTAKKGDVVLYDGREFLWTGSAWEQLGDEVSWALKTTTISAGTGLTGGGSLAANRTISLNPATIASLALADTAYQKPSTGIPKGDLASGVQTSLGLADSAYQKPNDGIPNSDLKYSWVKVGTTQINLGGQQTSLAGLVNVTMSGKLTIGSAEITWVNGQDGNPGHLEVSTALVTNGDQIVISGTPGSGGGGGGAGYLYELGDVYHDTNKTTVLRADGTPKAVGDVLQYLDATKGWVAVPASAIGGVTSVVGQSGDVTASQIASALISGGAQLTDTTYSAGSGLTLTGTTFSVTANTFQPLDSDLTAIAGLSGTGLLKKDGNGWGFDTSSYLTSVAFSDLTAHPNSLAGYGITDGVNDVEVTGSGNAVTGASISGHKLTLTKGTTFLTSHQTIYTLTFAAGSFSAGTYTPNSGAKTINVPTTLDHITDGATRKLSDYVTLATAQTISGKKTFSHADGVVIGGATLKWHPATPSAAGYLEIDSALVTVGDQIVVSGTPGQGGGGGGAGFLYELGDVLTDSGHTVVKQYDGSTNAANNNLFAFNGSKWYALKLGTNLAISNGTLNATDTTYSNGTGLALSNGVFSITSAYQTDIANGASAYSTLTTSQTKNKVLASPSNASGAPSFRALVAADLPSIENLTNFSTRVYDATTSRTANYVLAAPNGSNGAATFRKLVAADIPSLTVSKISDIASNYVSIATANTITAKHTFSNGILLNTASSWTSSDRAIAFSADGEDANIRYYSTNDSKGLTFNPNTGELKAAKFTRRGGTSSQFLKADGSVDSNTYLTGNQTITLSGDVSGSGTTNISVSIGSGKVTNAMLAGSIANGKLANSAITINGRSTSLGGSFNTASITAGTAGTSSATSGLSISVPYVTMNAYGIVTGYGTHTHSISKSDLTTALEGSSGYYVKKAGDTMSGDLIIEKTGGGLTIRGERLNSNANGGYIYLAGRYYDNDRNGVKIAAEYPGSVGYDIQDLVIYTSYNRSGNASPVWQEAMRIAAQGQTFINGQYTYSLYIDNVASGATSAGIRFRTEGTTIGGIFVNSSNDLYFSAGSSSTGSKVLTADNYDGYALPLAGGTMTGSIKLTNGTYINAESGYAMCGIGSGGETFYCGPGAEITSAFYLRSGNINLTHVKAGTNYAIWDASNSNLSTVDWAANNLTAAGTGTFNKIALTSTAAEAHLAFARGGYNYITAPEGGSINIVPNGLSVSAANSRLSVADSEVAITKASGEAMLVIQSTAANGAAGSIWFRARSSSYNGIMMVGNPGATSGNAYDRISLDFMAANATSSSSVTWKRVLRITYGGNVIVGASGATSTYTQYGNMTVNGSITSTGDQVISSDATKKKNWRDLKYGVADIAKTTAGVFDWKDGKGESAGTKAQDWMHLVPQLVHGEEGHMTLAYGQIAMLNTILLARRSEDHETRIKALELENAELRKEIERLRS